MEAPRGAREPTGTNGPTLNNNPHHACGCNNKQRTIHCRNHYTNHDQPTPPTRKQTVGERVEHQSCGGHSTGETPSNIPNLEAKPGSANGTATARLWESRTPPQHSSRGGLEHCSNPPLFPTPTRTHIPHTTHTRAATTHTQHNTQQCSTPVSTRAPTRHTHTHLPTWQTLCKLRNAPRHSLQRPRKHRLSFFALVSLFYSLRMKL